MKKTLIASSIVFTTLTLQSFSFDSVMDKVTDFKKFTKPSDMSAKEMVETMTGGVLSTELITKAFKQALKIGVTKAVDTLGQKGGFMDNPAVHIPLPHRFLKWRQ